MYFIYSISRDYEHVVLKKDISIPNLFYYFHLYYGTIYSISAHSEII